MFVSLNTSGEIQIIFINDKSAPLWVAHCKGVLTFLPDVFSNPKGVRSHTFNS